MLCLTLEGSTAAFVSERCSLRSAVCAPPIPRLTGSDQLLSGFVVGKPLLIWGSGARLGQAGPLGHSYDEFRKVMHDFSEDSCECFGNQ